MCRAVVLPWFHLALSYVPKSPGTETKLLPNFKFQISNCLSGRHMFLSLPVTRNRRPLTYGLESKLKSQIHLGSCLLVPAPALMNHPAGTYFPKSTEN